MINIGERVIVTKCYCGHGFAIGDELTIVEHERAENGKYSYKCECLDGITWWLTDEEFEGIGDEVNEHIDCEDLNTNLIKADALRDAADHIYMTFGDCSNVVNWLRFKANTLELNNV